MAINRQTNKYYDIISEPRSNNPLELEHFDALKNSILNIFKTPYMDRGACFNPDFGSFGLLWLQEPVDEHTAVAIKMTIFEDIRRNHPLVRVNYSETVVAPLPETTPGYYIKIAIDVSPYLEAQRTLEFNIFA